MKIYCSLFLLVFFHFNAHSDNKQKQLDSLELLLPKLSISEQLETYSNLCWDYGTIDLDRAMEFGKKAMVLALSHGDSLSIAQTYNDLGIVHFRKSDYDSALYYYFMALPLRRKFGDSASVASVASKIGAAYQEQGRYKRSSDFQMQALHLYEDLKDSIHLSQCMTNLARVYADNNEYQIAIKYNQQALLIFKHFNYSYGMATTQGSLALCYEMIGKNDSAVIMFEEALKLFIAMRDRNNESTALLGLGKLYRKLGEKSKGIDYYLAAIDASEEIGEKHTAAVAKANLAAIYIEQGKFNTAEKMLKEALISSQEGNILTLMHQCNRELSNLYEKRGEYKKSLEYKQLQYELRDSIFNRDKFSEIAKLQTQFETNPKEQKIALLNTKNQLNHLKIKRQRYSIFAAISALVLLIIISLLMINRRKLQQKAALEKAHNQYRKELLDATVEAEEKERQRIARELHDGIAQQLTGLKMAWQSLGKEIEPRDQQSADKLKEITKTLDDSADEVRNLSHQMMPRSLAENGLIPALDDMLEKTLKYSAIRYKFEHYAIEERLDNKVELSLYRITQELVNNIIKHSGANEVAIQLLKSKKYIVLMVEDNGKGFSKGKNKKKGIGLMNIESRIDTINGEINIEPSPGSGTVATIRVPVKG